MARVEAAEVQEIIQTTLTDLSAFISTANLIVTEQLEPKGLSADRLKSIELWLAAHFVAIRENSARVVEKQVGESRERYGENTRGVLGEGLKLTRYGQQAMALDSSGTLATLAKTTARFTVL